MEVILDTNFIISCLKRKIDFISELEGMGFRILVPLEVMQELKDLRLEKGHAERGIIELALQIVEENGKKTRLGNRTVDEGLIEKGKAGCYIATLDRAVQRAVDNTVLINNSRNSLEIVRK